MTQKVDEETLDGWTSDLDYVKKKFGKGHSFPSAQDRVSGVASEMRITQPEEVDEEMLENWHHNLKYAYRKFSKSLDFPSAQDRVKNVRNEIGEKLD